MSETLYNPVQGHKVFADAWVEAKAMLTAGHRMVLSLRKETRKDGQNKAFHDLIGQISDHVKGDLADKDDAKRILLSAFKIDTIRDNDLAEDWAKFDSLRMGRGLRGETVVLGNQTRDLTVKLGAAFIHWLNAFAIEQDIPLKAPRSWEGMDR